MLSVHTVVLPMTLFNSRRGRVVLENIVAYLFLAPAGFIIFLFGLFPVGFAFFVSLHRWRRFPDEFRGLDNYVDALGNFGYVIFFWLSLGLVYFALTTLMRLLRETADDRRGLVFLLPGAAIAASITTFMHWFFLLLPVVLDVPRRLRGQAISQGIFVDEFFASFRFPEVLNAADTLWLTLIAALAISVILLRLIQTPANGRYLFLGVLIAIGFIAGYFLLDLTLGEINVAIDEARTDGESLPVWSQIILISLGVGFLFLAYRLWNGAVAVDEDRRFFVRGVTVVALLLGAYLLVVHLPQALAEADDDVLQGFGVTVMYSLGSVPIQLALGLGLAVLLFQNIKGRAFFRVVYFLPYITPFVASSVIFALLFSHRSGAPANQLLTTLGLDTQTWLLEPTGINKILFGDGIPDILAGPGLALVVIIIYNIWVFAGYSTVIFLAGLGNIPKELYEAARIDGASGWRVFRHITLPLLSPTTFFLMLIATIGTFQAFTQIFLMRRAGAYDAVDTINIYIYQEIRDTNPDYAYGSAMAFVLFAVILALTLFQNRILGRKVFYG